MVQMFLPSGTSRNGNTAFHMKPVKDSLIYIIGELFAKCLPFLLLPYLTRQLGAAGFGTLSYWQTIAAFLLITLSFTQDGAVTRYFYVYGRRGLGRIVAAGYLYTAILGLILLGGAWLAQSPILAAVTLAAASQSVLGVQLALRQCQKRALSYTLIQTASGIITSVLTVLLLEYAAGDAVENRFWALFIGQSAVSAAAFYAAWGSLKLHLSRPSLQLSLRYLAAIGIPLIFHQSATLIKGQLDRFVIYQHYPADQVGIYSAAFQIALIFSVLLLAVNKAVVPHFFQALKNRRFQAADVRRWAVLSLLLTPLPPLFAWLLPENLYVWLLGAEYVGTKYHVCLFLFAFALTLPYLIMVNFLFYHGRNRTIAVISILSATIYTAVLFISARFGIAYVPLAAISGNLVILPLLFVAVKEPPQP